MFLIKKIDDSDIYKKLGFENPLQKWNSNLEQVPKQQILRTVLSVRRWTILCYYTPVGVF